jgi:hypothetical protein
LRDLVSWVQDSGWPGKHPQVDDIDWSIAQASAQVASPDRLARIRSGALARIRSGKALANFSSVAELAQLQASGDAETKMAEDHLTILARGSDPILLLPEFSGPAGPIPLHVIVDIAAPASTEAQLFWQTADTPYYDEARSTRAALDGTRQTLILSTPSIQATGKLRFDPGLIPGQYTLFSLQVWASAQGLS